MNAAPPMSGADAADEVHEVDVVIVGAGPAGLNAATQWVGYGHSVVVLEGRTRVGGRLYSPRIGGGDGPRFDLGATWWWPNERLISSTVDHAGLATFEQHLAGDMIYQDRGGARRIAGNQLDVASYRFADGAQSIGETLAAGLAEGVVRLGASVTAIVGRPDGRVNVSYVSTLSSAEASSATDWSAAQVIMAVPPATAVALIEIPDLDDALKQLASNTPVWMGATIKVVAVFKHAFWRDRGLAGSAFSHVGPMREIHDMSGPHGSPASLFGFVSGQRGDPAPTRSSIVEQLVAIFGPEAADSTGVVVHDWRTERFTSPPNVERLTSYELFGHSRYQVPALDGRFHWASTETATDSPGHIEGALSASTRAASAVSAALLTEKRNPI